MPTITKIDLSKPIENFAAKRGEALFDWAWETWKDFVREVLQVFEKDEISDENFVFICQKITLAGTLNCEPEGLSYLVDQVRGDKYYGWSGEWLKEGELPRLEVREEILRKLLEYTAKVVRYHPLEILIESMIRIVEVSDGRRENVRHILTPKSYSRSIHRLGLERKVSDILYGYNIKTLSDLTRYVAKPPPGGIIIGMSRRARPPFDPKAKLQKLEGIDQEAASAVMKTVNEWGGIMMSPASLAV